MRLRIGNELYKVHFRHYHEPWTMLRSDGRVRSGLWKTAVNLHTGDCKGKPCREGLAGEALCSRLDCFRKAVGRKLALARAVSRWTRDQRRSLWAAYWAVTPPQKTACR